MMKYDIDMNDIIKELNVMSAFRPVTLPFLSDFGPPDTQKTEIIP